MKYFILFCFIFLNPLFGLAQFTHISVHTEFTAHDIQFEWANNIENNPSNFDGGFTLGVGSSYKINKNFFIFSELNFHYFDSYLNFTFLPNDNTSSKRIKSLRNELQLSFNIAPELVLLGKKNRYLVSLGMGTHFKVFDSFLVAGGNGIDLTNDITFSSTGKIATDFPLGKVNYLRFYLGWRKIFSPKLNQESMNPKIGYTQFLAGFGFFLTLNKSDEK